MAVYQYNDLPQIPCSDESAYWANEQLGHMNDHRQMGVRTSHDYVQAFEYNDAGDHGMLSMQPMQRFLYDASPITYGLLHAKLDRGMPLQTQYLRQYEQWPSADCFPYSRNGSPDRTSVSGNSSQATHSELRSPHPFHTTSHGTPSDLSQSTLPYASGEYFDEGRYQTELPMTGGSINLRQIEYQPQEPETITEEQEHEHEHEHEQVDLKVEPEYEQEVVPTQVEPVVDDYQTFTDSGIGSSRRDAESVQPMTLDDEQASDSDYKPSLKTKRRRSLASSSSSRHTRKARGRKHSTSTLATSPRVTKRTRAVNTSPITSKASYNYNHDATDADNQRPFPCPLAAYGCISNFVSKNEWKRHVSTQHIKLGFWRCDLCATTVDLHDDSTIYHNDFNRKDLFTQHLRRMHATPANQGPAASRQQRSASYPVTEDNISEHQQRCYQTLRNTPPQSACLFCDREFQGPVSWEERMEHVGRHLEKERKGNGVSLDPKRWNRDEVLEQWLLDEGLVELQKSGEWKIGDGKPKRTVKEEETDD